MFRRALVAALMLCASPLLAQETTGTIIGTVADVSSEVLLPDVVVTLTSPALQGEEIAITDDEGRYRITGLPVGEYTLTLEAEGFRVFTREGIKMRAGVILRADASLFPLELAGEEEEAELARPPTVDVGTTQVQTTVGEEFLDRIPVSLGATQSFESAASIATPGARGDTYGTSIAGTTSPENNFMIDGLNVNSASHGINGAPLSLRFVDQLNVIAGGYMPEHGRSTGGILNVITKSGSNEWHGGAGFRLVPGILRGERREIERAGTVIRTDRELESISELNLELGGPIVKDKVWFFAGATLARTAFDHERSLVPEGATEAIPGSTQQFKSVGYNAQLFGKLTYRLTSNQRLTVTGFTTPSRSGGREFIWFGQKIFGLGEGGNIVGDFDALAHTYSNVSYGLQAKHTAHLFDRHLILDTTVGYGRQAGFVRAADETKVGSGKGLAGKSQVIWRRSRPGPRSIAFFEKVPDGFCEAADVEDATRCPVRTYVTGGPGFLEETASNSAQLRSTATVLFEALGSHVVKGGVDGIYNTYFNERGYSGGRIMREATDGSYFLDSRQYGYLTGPDEEILMDSLAWRTHSLTVGGFLQDSWSPARDFTINFGLRYDTQLLFGGDGNLTLSLPHQISPRVGVVYDPTGEGRGKVFANYARFYQSVPLDIADRAGSGEPSAIALNDASTCDPRVAAAGDCRDRFPIGGPESTDQEWIVHGAGKTPVDPDIVAPSSDEVVIGGEYEAFPETRVGVTYTKRWLNDTIEDMSRDEATTYFIGNPGRGMASDFPKAVRDYDALTAYAQRDFGDSWLGQVSYTLSSVRGNYAGLFRPETGQLDPNINSDFDLQSLMPNREGPLPGDHTHQIKTFVAKDIELPYGMILQVGGSVRAESGAPTDYLGAHEIYGVGEVFLLPRGSGDRLPWRVNGDLHVGYGINVGRGSTVTLGVDVTNLFNFQEVVAIDDVYTTSSVLPIAGGSRDDLPSGVRAADGSSDFDAEAEVNPNFGRPVAFQAPRTIQFTARIDF
jgi:hypothetical protein